MYIIYTHIYIYTYTSYNKDIAKTSCVWKRFCINTREKSFHL